MYIVCCVYFVGKEIARTLHDLSMTLIQVRNEPVDSRPRTASTPLERHLPLALITDALKHKSIMIQSNGCFGCERTEGKLRTNPEAPC